MAQAPPAPSSKKRPPSSAPATASIPGVTAAELEKHEREYNIAREMEHEQGEDYDEEDFRRGPEIEQDRQATLRAFKFNFHDKDDYDGWYAWYHKRQLQHTLALSSNPVGRYYTPPAPTETQAIIGYDLSKQLVELIESKRWSMIVGCVAWFTNPAILEALARSKIPCCFIVQKEDFLRPELIGPLEPGKPRTSIISQQEAQELRDKYDELTAISTQGYMSQPGRELIDWLALVGVTYAMGETDVPDSIINVRFGQEAVRCAGYTSKNHGAKMHHKFAVFFEPNKPTGKLSEPDGKICPTTVWMGSCNWSKNADNNRDSALVLVSDALAKEYAQEWLYVMIHSEPLDWEVPDSAPQHRFEGDPHSLGSNY